MRALIWLKNRNSNANIFRYINSMKQNNQNVNNYQTDEFLNPMQIFDYCKQVLSKLISSLFESVQSIPYVVKCMLKILIQTCNYQPEVVDNILSKFLYHNWLKQAWFVVPELYGLIEGGSVDRLESILHDFSELIESIFKSNKDRLSNQAGWK